MEFALPCGYDSLLAGCGLLMMDDGEGSVMWKDLVEELVIEAW